MTLADLFSLPKANVDSAAPAGIPRFPSFVAARDYE